MKTRKLSLKREILTELSDAQLSSVAGGSHAGCAITDNCLHPSVDQACPTLPINPCVQQITTLFSDTR